MRSFLLAASVLAAAAIAGLLLELDCGWWPSAVRGAMLGSPLAVVAGAAVAQRKVRPITIALLLVTSGLAWLALNLSESKDLRNPDVDTNFAPGFSVKSFNAVTPGMTERDVSALLGAPFQSRSEFGSDAVWSYSADGACGSCDRAWREFQVIFANKRVKERRVGWRCD